MIRAVTLLLYRWRILLHDALAIPLAWMMAYWLRYNLGTIPPDFLQGAMSALPLVVAVQLSVNFFIGVHRGEWRFVSLPDLSLIVRAVSVGTVAVAFALFLVAERLAYVPRSVFILYALVLLGVMGGSRLLYRLFRDRHFSAKAGRKVLILGAGTAGEQLLRDLR